MKREGYEVHVAADGIQALEQLRRLHPQLVLLDVMMPGKTGFEVCQGMAMGADAYMTKPFSTGELVQRVRGLLQGPASGA